MWYVKLPQRFDIKEGFQNEMRTVICGYGRPATYETRRNQTEPDGARLPVLFRNPSGREPRTRQNIQPCSHPTPNGRFTILLQLRDVFKKDVPPSCSSMTSINTFAASYLNTQGLNNSCLKSRQRRP